MAAVLLVVRHVASTAACLPAGSVAFVTSWTWHASFHLTASFRGEMRALGRKVTSSSFCVDHPPAFEKTAKQERQQLLETQFPWMLLVENAGVKLTAALVKEIGKPPCLSESVLETNTVSLGMGMHHCCLLTPLFHALRPRPVCLAGKEICIRKQALPLASSMVEAQHSAVRSQQ